MTLAGKLYFDAMAKIGENAAASPVSRELGKCPCCPGRGLQTVDRARCEIAVDRLHL